MRVPVLLSLAIAACGNAAPPAIEPLAVESIAVPFDARDAARQGEGRLSYAGGVALRSATSWFGGLSGLRCPDRCYAVGDAGFLLSFDRVERNGRLVGIENVRGGALLDREGAAGAKAARDAESLVLSPGGAEALVGFERSNSLWVVPLGQPEWRARQVYTLPEMKDWPLNGGAETLVMLPGGVPLVIAEEAPDGGDRPAIAIGAVKRPEGTRANLAFRYRPPANFSPTDAALLDDERLIILNRAFSPLTGVAMALVEVPLVEIKEGATVQGREITRLRPPVSIDNMEGIDIRREDGRVFIYLVSDDNFNAAQRTLLLKFELLP
ncbi:esterase-like activity of phytase family protein [Sphingosinicella xenopeptidilytica]|uniref:Esterase-like activity of phytase family protein n=1 Tax=Sphingosinicella xenopeptidilytica TaxID=364098 RepID=A0ABW3BZ40_SPHXN